MSDAILFQSMPPLAPDEYEALTDSIRRHGVQVPILVDEAGVVIDGHHRRAIAESLGVHCPRTRVIDKTDAEKRTLALTLNLDRRNLTREQRRAIVAASVKADPQLSDREHARRTGVDHKTAAVVRGQLAERGEIPHVATRTDSLGRQQPAVKPDRIDFATGEVISETASSTIPQGELVSRDVGEVLNRPGGEAPSSSTVTDVEQQDDAPASPAPRPVVGLDGKTYSRPDLKPAEPRRRPLRDGFRDASLDLAKVVGRFERLVGDDRFPKNREEVARYANDLLRAREALDRLIEQMNCTTNGQGIS